MIEPIGRLIAERRKELQMPQQDLARLLGIANRTLCRWERELERVPQEVFSKLQDILVMPLDWLSEHADPNRERRRPTAPEPIRGVGRRRRDLPRYACKGTVSQMLSLSPIAQAVYDRAHDLGLRDPDFARLERTVPHDSILELLVIFLLIAAGFKLERHAPLDLGINLLILEDYRERYGGHLRRDVLVLRRADVTVVVIPQVWLAVTAQSRSYRADFLIAHFYHGPLAKRVDRRRLQGRSPCVYVILEIDGAFHAQTANEDARRVIGLALPFLRRNRSGVCRDDFVDGLLRDLHDRLMTRVGEGNLFPE